MELNDTIRTQKHVTDVKLDSTVDRILLLWGPFISEECNCTSMIKQVHLFTDGIVQYSMLNFISEIKIDTES